MEPYRLRQAVENDAPLIKALITQVRINPTGLDWRRFTVAETPQGELCGCGQVKPHRDGSRELASIAVAPKQRKQGVARAIIEYLLAENPGPLYLTCRARLGPFYERFGFRTLIDPAEMPAYFRRVSRLAQTMGWIKLIPKDLLVMKRDG
jgi:amino-acid N-acetyltransferase